MPYLSRRQLVKFAGLGALGLFFAKYFHLDAKTLQRIGSIPRPVIISVSGSRLEQEEMQSISDLRPTGFLLHRYNILNRSQLSSLTASLREAAGSDILIMTDQEGGVIMRLQPPHWPVYPASSDLGFITAQHEADGKRATYLTYRQMAYDLAECGINVNVAPVLDLYYPGNASVNEHRSFSAHSATVVMLGRIACEATLEGGVLPVLKHIPGQGRVAGNTDRVRTHITASEDELKEDWAVFRALSDMPLAMISHAIFDALDATQPAALSEAVVRFIRTKIGFQGLLMTDALLMPSLPHDARANTQAALKAGNNLFLYGNNISQLNTLLTTKGWPAPDATTHQRVRSALSQAREAYKPCDIQALRSELGALVQHYNINLGAYAHTYAHKSHL